MPEFTVVTGEFKVPRNALSRTRPPGHLHYVLIARQQYLSRHGARIGALVHYNRVQTAIGHLFDLAHPRLHP